MALQLEMAKTLIALLFEEIDKMYDVERQNDITAMQLCCCRNYIFDSLTHHVFDDISAVADQLNSMANYKEK